MTIFVVMGSTPDDETLRAVFTNRETAERWRDDHNKGNTYRWLDVWVEEWKPDPVYPDDGSPPRLT